MAKYYLTNKAINDLTLIWDYTHDTWSESQANKYYDLLLGGCQQIANNPAIGKQYDQVSNGIFGLHIGKHIIFYQAGLLKTVIIVRILHSSMDIRMRIED